MQPTYLPWIGYFDLIDQSDIFVFLDTVQFEKQSWQQRNRIKTPQGPQWLTVPVLHSFGEKILEVQIDPHSPWRRKHWVALLTHYQKAPFWPQYSSCLAPWYQEEWGKLAELNVTLVKTLCGALGIQTKIVRSSELPPLPGKKAEPLIALCEIFDADVYLSPAGSHSYLESDIHFQEKGISLVFQHFEHPIYPQLYGEFISHLSAIDLIMNIGAEALSVIRSGRKPRRRLSAWEI